MLTQLQRGAPASAQQAMASGPRGLASIIGTNLGPCGTQKMLVSGSGDIKITKDGNVLCQQMQIQHPVAQMVARAATAQDSMTGDGTTTTIVLISEFMKQAQRHIEDGLSVRSITDGYEQACAEAIKFLDEWKTPVLHSPKDHREFFVNVARSSLCTKLDTVIANNMAEIVTDAVTTVYNPAEMLDLHMVEIMHMQHKLGVETQFIAGLVMDHGTRHPDMPKSLSNAWVLTLNVSLEYEKTEDGAQFYHTSADMRAKMAQAERAVVEKKVQKVIDLKRAVCTKDNGRHFLLVNQKGIDPLALDMLAKEGIMALRRAKKRNMERLTLACGGHPLNTVEHMSASDLGFAGNVVEHVLGEDKYTFVEDVKNPKSCTILVRGPNKHTIEQIKDATRDGLRAVKNVLTDKAVVAGGGAWEIACARHLSSWEGVTGRPKIGVRAFAEALLIVPKTLAENGGFDVQSTVINVQEKQAANTTSKIGINLTTGNEMDAAGEGVWDGFCVKRQQLKTSCAIASQLLLVDEVIKGGSARKAKGQDEPLDE